MPHHLAQLTPYSMGYPESGVFLQQWHPDKQGTSMLD